MSHPWHASNRRVLLRPVVVLLAIVAGAALGGDQRAFLWYAALVLVGGATVARTVADMFRGQFASDIVASLAIVGAIVFAEPLAGLIVVLMQTGGEALERWAEGRATEAVRALESSAPRIAHRLHADGTVENIRVEEIGVGEHCIVRPGEMVPCDGNVVDGETDLDLARLTGEPLPVRVTPGRTVRSGSVVIARPITIRATAPAAHSLYARIVELVRDAQAAKAPLQRLADKWAVWFTPLTLVVCALTYWLSGDATRVLAVLVVATPCPLILAAPVAIIAGINRAARARVIVRTGGALERLASIDAVALDKTGTLTIGHPEVREVRAAVGHEAATVLSLAAAVEQHSSHPMAQAIVRAQPAASRGSVAARDIREDPGRGVTGRWDGHTIAVGSPRWARDISPEATRALDELPPPHASETVAVVLVDGHYAGAIVFADSLRPGLTEMFAELRTVGVTRTSLLSGDRSDRVAHVARELGVAEALGDLLPDGKVEALRAMTRSGHRVAMIGDGVNDAPALAAATVGIALAAHGGGIAADSADAVLLADDLRLVPHAIRIAQRSMRIARQSIYAGVALSAFAMIWAAVGVLAPVPGALVQEAIDVAVILNAIRAARE